MSADLLEIDTVYDLCYTDHMGYRHYIHDVLVTSCDPSSCQEGSFFPMFEIKGEIDDVECNDTVEDEFIKVAEGFHAMSGELNEAIEDPRCDIGPDPTNPNYYKQASIELIDFMEETSSPEEFQGYCKNNVLKYVVRYKNKNGVEDLNKAMWYLQRLIESETK